MDTQEEIEAGTALERALEAVQVKELELAQAVERERELEARLRQVQLESENTVLHVKVEKFRAVEKARQEEREHAELLSRDMRERFQVERKALEEKVADLEEKVAAAMSAVLPVAAPLSFLDSSTGAVTTSNTIVAASSSLSPMDSSLLPVATPTTSVSVDSSTGISSTAPATGSVAPTAAVSTGVDIVVSTGANVTSTVTAPIPAPTVSDPLNAELIRLLEAQSQALVAQAQAAALPVLPVFDGETQVGEDDFEHWKENFQERAILMKWTDETKLCQLKLHLTKTAAEVFRVLPETDKTSYARAMEALQRRFRPIGIEELRGLDFHRKVQGEESVERLGMQLQQLGRKAFPSIEGKDFDRLLKGRFYQALHTKWQRKLGAPRPEESFSQLYERARTIEQHEQQYLAAAASHGEHSNKKTNTRNHEHDNPVPKKTASAKSTADASGSTSNSSHISRSQSSFNQMRRLCYVCGKTDHLARSCPTRMKSKNFETPARPTIVSRTSCLEAKEATKSYDELSEDELESLLAQRRLQKEKYLLTETCKGDVACVQSTPKGLKSNVGPSLLLDMTIGGVPVAAVVDTGSQSTIVSRFFLHRIVEQYKREEKVMPELVLPTARLYGKDGRDGGHELYITAQVDLPLQADGVSVTVPVFVQPNSAQECLLGMNAAPLLGLKFLDSKGRPLRSVPENKLVPSSARVSLLEAVTIPHRKCRFVKGKVSGECNPGDQFLFEADKVCVEPLGVCGVDSLLRVDSNRTVYLPLCNFNENIVSLESGTELGCVEPYQEDMRRQLHVLV